MSLIEQREGIEAGRLDMFVDGAFAFTLTLLAIAGAAIPRDLNMLLHALGGIPAFACSFAQISLFWYAHVHWRVHCQLADRSSLILSLVLVFFALIFVYPLHMVFASLFSFISNGALPSDFQAQTADEMKGVFICYGAAYTCMATTLALLYRHGARNALHMGHAIRNEARVSTMVWASGAAVGLISIMVALLIPPHGSSQLLLLPGCCYFLLFLARFPLRAYRHRLEQVSS
ncbi:TMEM175 family protein [Dyella silvatica]|uniref:TMEM175 family protein n=1 Tax=Dyella silvatica TaxID=2992128 RepID=UPI00224F22A7|nr:TMEM175 family protein [Dyella silvatica]